MSETVADLPLRSGLLPSLYQAHEREGWLSPETVAKAGARLGIPAAEAWEAATSYPDFRLSPPDGRERVCEGLSCTLNGGRASEGEAAAGCQFRCYAAPVHGASEPLDEAYIRHAGPLLAPEDADWRGLERSRSLTVEQALTELDASGLRGRGGAYFPLARKWQAALAQGRPIALVVNAEEGEPGVFKDRAILCRRPRRFVEGLTIAAAVLQPAVTIVFINGEARAARAALEQALAAAGDIFPVRPAIVPGGGGYILGEETTLLNALEGRKPVPRLRPPYPVESGLFGMPTVVNNVETLANLPLIFRAGAAAFRAHGTREAPGTKLISLSGRIQRPGIYEVPFGTPLVDVLTAAGGAVSGDITAILAGGPSGGFLAPPEFLRPLLPGAMHPAGAITGSGGIVVLDSSSDIRAAALAMARFNAEESCGKCTPCREGTPRLHEALAAKSLDGLDDMLEVVGTASLCGLGQMAPGPIRSALHFWPELFL